ncbi:MAG TPA: hypothetical protein VJS43_05875 [Candidatus Acidoferrales bacterium]|nr:hypothetical protein [Candidatus Acidoferrales bacterium]
MEASEWHSEPRSAAQKALEPLEAQQADAPPKPVPKVSRSSTPQPAAQLVPPDGLLAERPPASEEEELCSVPRAEELPEPLPPELHLRVAQLARRTVPLVSGQVSSEQASRLRLRLPLRRAHGNACALILRAGGRSSSSASSSL